MLFQKIEYALAKTRIIERQLGHVMIASVRHGEKQDGVIHDGKFGVFEHSGFIIREFSSATVNRTPLRRPTRVFTKSHNDTPLMKNCRLTEAGNTTGSRKCG